MRKNASRISDKHSYQKQYHRNLRLEVLEAYGNQCACCAESRRSFLSLDHIANNGSSERRRINGANSGCSNTEWNDLKKRGWPKDGYRLLCYNCNLGRHRNWDNPGICPHEIERGVIVSETLKSVNAQYLSDQTDWLEGVAVVSSPSKARARS